MPTQAELLDQLRHHRNATADLAGHLFERPPERTMQRARTELKRVEREGGASLHFAPTYALLEEAGWELSRVRDARRRRPRAWRGARRRSWRRP